MKTAFEACIAPGGVAVFPADTVYGLACDPENEEAVARLYALKGRAPDKPAAVMFFDRDLALASLPELGPRTRGLLERLLPRRRHRARSRATASRSPAGPGRSACGCRSCLRSPA